MDKTIVYKTKKKVVFYSILVSLFLVSIKLIGGHLSNSPALIADGLHSFSDLASAIAIYLGIILSNIKSKSFPYGLYKIENLVSLVSAFAIFFAGYEICHQILFNEITQISSLPIALSITFITLLTTYLFSHYELKKGQQVNSPGLIADAKHIMTDFYSSIIVVIGILAQYFQVFWLLKLVVIIIVGFIFHSGFNILVETIKVLLDASVDNETIEQVKKIINKHKEITKLNYIHGRNSGSYKFLEIDLALDFENLAEAHEFVEHIKTHILKEIEFVEEVIIHFEPSPQPTKIAVLTNDNNIISNHFGNATKVHIFTKTNNKFTHKVYSNPGYTLEHGKSIELSEFLNNKHVNCLIMRPMTNKRPIKLLEAFKIKIVFTEYRTLSEINLNEINCKK